MSEKQAGTSRPTRIDAIGVIVPAADEQELLPRCLSALGRSRELVSGAGVRVRVVVVLDGCTDGSRAAVAGAGVETVTVAHRNVGRARAAGVEHLLRDTRAPARLWLASTDADSEVPADWLTVMLDRASRGAHLVLGTVRPGLGLDPAVSREWHRRHVLADGHPYVHGANLGIRADLYCALGGWSPLALGEDVDLVARASARDGVRIVRTAAIPVRTSARLAAPAGGFAGYLRGLADDVDEMAG
ncbi:MAG TPA: glycosyltransferase [Jatrophihabitans sp.]|nr:glycosyltransferase [Jatrophihabitans sp.]